MVRMVNDHIDVVEMVKQTLQCPAVVTGHHTYISLFMLASLSVLNSISIRSLDCHI